MTSQSPVFLLNSRHPLVCATPPRLPETRSCLSRSYACKLPSSFNVVLSSALVCSTSPPVSVSGTVCCGSCFLEPLHRRDQSSKTRRYTRSVTTRWLRNIHLIPIGYAFLPRLRGRLTLRRLTLRRNPWTFGDSVSHTVCRYSCQHSHFRYLQGASRLPLHRLTERSATACIAASPKLRCTA